MWGMEVMPEALEGGLNALMAGVMGGGNGGRRRWELGRRLGAAVEVMEVKGDARAPFIGEIRRRGEPWGGGRGAVGRRAPWAPLMAIGAAAARFAAAQG